MTDLIFQIMYTDVIGKAAWVWLVFILTVAVLIVLDLGILNKKHKEISVRESLIMSLFYISIALIFGRLDMVGNGL